MIPSLTSAIRSPRVEAEALDGVRLVGEEPHGWVGSQRDVTRLVAPHAQRERMTRVDREGLTAAEVEAHQQPGHELIAAELLEEHVVRGTDLLDQGEAPPPRVAQARSARLPSSAARRPWPMPSVITRVTWSTSTE